MGPNQHRGKRLNNLILKTNETQAWELMQRQCKAFLDSGFLPKHIQNIAQAITIAWKGRELGLPPLQAFSSISVINGKPVLSAELMLALVYQRYPQALVEFKTPPEKQNLECTLAMARPNHKPQEFRFTIEDAKRAGIYKNAWLTYPQALLRARAISAAVRAVFPDVLMGGYTPEEMGENAPLEGSLELHEDDHQEVLPPPKKPDKAAVSIGNEYPASHKPAMTASLEKLEDLACDVGMDEGQFIQFVERHTGKAPYKLSELEIAKMSTKLIEELDKKMGSHSSETPH